MSQVRVGLAQFRPTKGAPDRNLDRIEQLFRDCAAAEEAPDVLVLPETILTGYFLEGGVRECASSAEEVFQQLAERHRRAGAPPIEIALGFYEVWQQRLYNAAMWAALGGRDAGIRHIHHKVFLPTYGVFDEERFVESGREVKAFPTRFGRAAMLICEDAWHSLTGTIAAVDGAQFIAVLSASPARGLTPDPAHVGVPKSVVRWERTVRDLAAEHGVHVGLAQLVGFEGGKAFPGGSVLVGPAGEVTARAPLFEDAVVHGVITTDEIARVRSGMPLLADLEARLPDLITSLERARGVPVTERRHPVEAEEASPEPDSLPAPAVDLSIDPELTRRWLVEFLRDEVLRRRRFSRAIVGISGGVDSAVAAWLAAEALGPENVIGVRMPYRTSSAESLEHGRLVTSTLGIPERTVEITAAVDGYAAACGVPPTPTRLGNVMARMRMITLFDLGAALDALPIGTGNKSERLLGYFTWHADDAPPVNPIGDLFKTQVWALARHLGIPDAIVSKPASADLVAGQTDESDFGITYTRADPILDLLLLGHRDVAIQAAGFQAEEIATVRRRLDGTHWKRRLPSVAMVSQTAIGEYYLRPVDY